MAKGIKTFNNKGGSAAKFPLSSKRNAPVRRVYRKPRVVTKTGQNKTAIMTLARQVKSLQQQRFGEIQSHTQYSGFLGAVAADKLKASQPYCFGMNNFYDQPIYKGTTSGTVATYASVGTLARQTYDGGLDDEYEWNARRNTDTVSNVEYKPVFTRVNFEFGFNPTLLTNIGYIRITMLKIKPYNSTNKLAVQLPVVLGAYRNLAEHSGVSTKNYLDKTYHTILSDKYIKVAPPFGTNPLSEYKKYCRIDMRYPDMLLKPDITTSPAGQTFWTNTKTSEQIWCLISLSSQLDGALNNVLIGKFDSWRDAHGAS